MTEGERWAEKVGKRYSVFGFKGKEKDKDGDEGDRMEWQCPMHAHGEGSGHHAWMKEHMSTMLAGDAANAIVAYALTKVSSSYENRIDVREVDFS